MSDKRTRPLENKNEIDETRPDVPSVSEGATGHHRKLCVTCGERPTISDSSPYCPLCMRKRMKKKTSGKSALKGTASLKAEEDKRHKEITPLAGNMDVVIDFKEYPQILSDVRQLADAEIRPLELQIIYLLKRHFEESKRTQDGI